MESESLHFKLNCQNLFNSKSGKIGLYIIDPWFKLQNLELFKKADLILSEIFEKLLGICLSKKPFGK